MSFQRKSILIMNKRTKYLQFSEQTKRDIVERDQGCIFCRQSPAPYDNSIFDIAHIVNKSQGGLGIIENGVLSCRYHHHLLDNSEHNQELREFARQYLQSIYEDWNIEKLYYRKGEF